MALPCHTCLEENALSEEEMARQKRVRETGEVASEQAVQELDIAASTAIATRELAHRIDPALDDSGLRKQLEDSQSAYAL
ncbi:hypothetical protein RUM44_000001 [Polyplax serrata]|uniref:Uncharacterized protein n=1 Tax=Polyplax serrata TaxID=468196 RepID=A0ABR1B4A2_POLSC